MRLERLLELLEAERIERRGDVGVSYARAPLLSDAHTRLAYDQADELSRAPLHNRDGFICDSILLTAHCALHDVPNGRDREQRWLGYDGRRRRGRRLLVWMGRFGRVGHLRRRTGGGAPHRLEANNIDKGVNGHTSKYSELTPMMAMPVLARMPLPRRRQQCC